MRIAGDKATVDEGGTLLGSHCYVSYVYIKFQIWINE